jgi:hypothetical protein
MDIGSVWKRVKGMSKKNDEEERNGGAQGGAG